MNNLFGMIKHFIFLVMIAVVSAIALGAVYSGQSGNVALVEIHGMIVSDKGFVNGAVTSSSILDNLEDANHNPAILAIVLDINSPGGTVVASKEVAEYVRDIEKPVICRIHESGASGAYWIASYCDRIVADEFSLVGSVGVTGSYLEFSGLLEKYNVSYVELVSGSEKEIGSPYKEPQKNDIKKLQELIDMVNVKFLAEVVRNRGLNEEQEKAISEGGVFSGRKGMELGLVDVLGGQKEVESIVKEFTNLTSIYYFKYKGESDVLDLISLMGKSNIVMEEGYSLKAI